MRIRVSESHPTWSSEMVRREKIVIKCLHSLSCWLLQNVWAHRKSSLGPEKKLINSSQFHFLSFSGVQFSMEWRFLSASLMSIWEPHSVVDFFPGSDCMAEWVCVPTPWTSHPFASSTTTPTKYNKTHPCHMSLGGFLSKWIFFFVPSLLSYFQLSPCCFVFVNCSFQKTWNISLPNLTSRICFISF